MASHPVIEVHRPLKRRLTVVPQNERVTDRYARRMRSGDAAAAWVRVVVWIAAVALGASAFAAVIAETDVLGFATEAYRQIGQEIGQAALGPDAATRSVVVRRGDTLWSLARQYGPEGADVRAVVDWIRRHNQLESAVLAPGQSIVVPLGT